MPIDLSEKFIQNAIDDMAELPWEFRKEFHDLGLDDYQTEQLMLDKKNVYYFKKCLAEKPLDAKICGICSWLESCHISTSLKRMRKVMC